jgi:hypothetical protein
MALMVENNRSTQTELALVDELRELAMPLRPTAIDLLSQESSKLRDIANNTSGEELRYFKYQVEKNTADLDLSSIQSYQEGTLPSARSLVLAA